MQLFYQLGFVSKRLAYKQSPEREGWVGGGGNGRNLQRRDENIGVNKRN